jgi:hypothetical protein
MAGIPRAGHFGPYHGIVVMATKTGDLIRRQTIEEGFCEALRPTPCRSMLGMAPPYLPNDPDATLARMGQSGMDALLVVAVNLDEANHNASAIDTFSSDKSATGKKEIRGVKSDSGIFLEQIQGMTEGEREGQVKSLQGGHRQSEGKLLLIDLQSGQPSWGGAFATRSGTDITSAGFAKSEATPVVAALKKAGLLGNGPGAPTNPSPAILPWLAPTPDATPEETGLPSKKPKATQAPLVI